MNSPIRLHIANIDLCQIVTDSIIGIINTLMDELDEVSKYKVVVNLVEELDNLSQTCYDEASADAQEVIECFEEAHWEYKNLPSYREYENFISTFLSVGNVNAPSEESIRYAASASLDEFEDVAEEFDIKPTKQYTLQGQLRFPNDYVDETALALGQPHTVAEEKKKARAEFLANVKAQQNTSQSK